MQNKQLRKYSQTKPSLSATAVSTPKLLKPNMKIGVVSLKAADLSPLKPHRPVYPSSKHPYTKLSDMGKMRSEWG